MRSQRPTSSGPAEPTLCLPRRARPASNALSPRASAAGLSRGRARRSKPKPMNSIPIRRRNFTARCRRSATWNEPLPVRRIPKGSCCATDRSTDPAPGCSPTPCCEELRHRRMPLIGDGAGWWSFIHVEDAASATVKAIERGKSGNIYNIVDDEPAQVRDWLPALANILGAKPPFHVPAWIARLLAGEHMVAMMTQVRAGSNAKARKELDWQPAHPSWREGFAEVARASANRDPRRKGRGSRPAPRSCSAAKTRLHGEAPTTTARALSWPKATSIVRLPITTWPSSSILKVAAAWLNCGGTLDSQRKL